ncbi:putative ABC transport system, lipoprotein [Lunatimonas lonarensis]|uniref:Putative ABC transport system, lipoprotein n=1 Tax=Lunatimonas lonarensis TaxID=1232681 RepID=R7ZXJ0_9BACT|nr:efflux RND transporter periplasmic adaptor subunit [Lunatimonas lonarensis]EON78787.1 putative ABC transport system, lipoprotein [Lunatimonas lonarensis]
MSKAIVFCALLFVSSIFFGCKEEKEKGEEIPMESFREEVQPTSVQTGVSQRKSFDYLINATGKIEASSHVMVIVERQGYLTDLTVSEGDRVQAGQVIAKLDNRDSKFALEKARVELRSSMAVFENEKLGFPTIYGDPALDSLALAEWDTRLKAKSGVLSAEISLREAELEIEKSTIKAPITGTVADVKLKQGSLVNSGDEVCEIISTGQLEIRVKVLESDINFITTGQTAEIYPVSGGEEGLRGQVVAINPKVDENGLVQVTIKLQNQGRLLPGMNARAVIRAPQNNSLVVPKQAVVYRSGRPVVFTIENNQAIWNYVEVGKDNGREMEILDGLTADVEVIVSNNVQLAHQAPIRILNDAL